MTHKSRGRHPVVDPMVVGVTQLPPDVVVGPGGPDFSLGANSFPEGFPPRLKSGPPEPKAQLRNSIAGLRVEDDADPPYRGGFPPDLSVMHSGAPWERGNLRSPIDPVRHQIR